VRGDSRRQEEQEKTLKAISALDQGYGVSEKEKLPTKASRGGGFVGSLFAA
jgi:hypothetical protein